MTQKALLIHYPDPNVAEEAKGLAEAAGYEPTATVVQRYLSRSRMGIGVGKAQEVSAIVRERGIDTVLFDSRLNASQTYNLAKLCKVEVKDREKLILEIFARRATTAEAKLQVKLAELNYELPRARDKVRMAKSGEQPGFFGLGKYEVDVYVRMMKRQVAVLRRKVEEVRGQRGVQRRQRDRAGLTTVAITGYTGSGKTTLFNSLTGETKEAGGGAFTTLAPTTRSVYIEGRKVLFSDTVGFISRLPTYLIEAFKSTLEEVSLASVVLLLLDASQPADKFQIAYESCMETLAELGVFPSRVFVVFNKIDLARGAIDEMTRRLSIVEPVSISAKTGEGLSELERRLSTTLSRIQETVIAH
ncbi:MAG TPA: GTPase HflX [Nitrososphaerales archaeon]|nr:GTPase HflX [Nitrososphaerales archaeon]